MVFRSCKGSRDLDVGKSYLPVRVRADQAGGFSRVL